MTKDSLLQSNIDFDYLGDDDDDDDSGGAGGNVFDATINASLVSSAAIGAAIGFQVDATAGGGAQTSGAIKVTITEASGATAATPITSALAGWSESGWSYASGVWANMLTKSSVAVGTTSPTFSVAATSGGTGGGFIIATSSAPSPRTAEATGAGNSRTVLISAAAFNAVGSGPATVVYGGSLTWTVAITASGSAQTNGTVVLAANGATGTEVTSMTTIGLDGWSESGWVRVSSPGPWKNTLTETSVSAGATNPSFTVNVAATGESLGPVTLDTTGGPPQTDQATGAGNTVSVVMVR